MNIDNLDLIKAAKNGDKKAFDKFLIENQGLCYYIAQRFKNLDSIDDIASIAKIGLIKSIKTFDLNKNIQFATYAMTIMKNEILVNFRKERKMKNFKFISLDANFGEDGEKEMTLLDIIPTPEKDISYEDYKGLDSVLKLTLDSIKDRDKEIFKMYFFENKSQIEIAEKFNLSQPQVSRLIMKIKKLLKKNASKIGFID